jgi:lipoyl synthase
MNKVTFFLPGMFTYNGLKGRYPCISITGGACTLQCDHCRGSLLRSMTPALGPGDLVAEGLRIAEQGALGVLISGGSDERGRLPWDAFIPAIAEIKKRTSLYVSIHSGLVDETTALGLRDAGVDQALLDVVGDDETYRRVCHVPFGISQIASSLESLAKAGLPVAPHIICGLCYGHMKGEKNAVDLISRFDVEQVVVVSLMPNGVAPFAERRVKAEEVAEVIAEVRLRMPGVKVSLGCARERGNTRMEILALEAGVDHLVLPSEEAIRWAVEKGMEVRYQRTCCSVAKDISKTEW